MVVTFVYVCVMFICVVVNHLRIYEFDLGSLLNASGNALSLMMIVRKRKGIFLISKQPC